MHFERYLQLEEERTAAASLSYRISMSRSYYEHEFIQSSLATQYARKGTIIHQTCDLTIPIVIYGDCPKVSSAQLKSLSF